MRSWRLQPLSVALLLLGMLLPGCAAPSPAAPATSWLERLSLPPHSSGSPQETGPIQQAVLFDPPLPSEASPPRSPNAPIAVLLPAVALQPAPAEPARLPLAEVAELSVEGLVEEVLARNPSLKQMVAAFEAARARCPQVSSLDDPMLGVQAAPGAWTSRDLDGGTRVEVSQKYPWCGKLALRGENAKAEASAAGNSVEDMRLQLVESARMAFYDYYLVGRALDVNQESLKLLRELKKNAETRYATGLVPQQDVLQADVEIGRTQERDLTLERMRQVAVARINTLMHLPPDQPLPPPPDNLAPLEAPPDPQALRQAALERRPDLKALKDRIAAEEAALGLAHKDYCPDFEVMAAYDSIWQEKPLRAQVGVRINLPVRLERRGAAVSEAEARVAGRQAELARLADQVGFEVQQAYEQIRESDRTVQLYESTILPAARQNVEAARSAYLTGKVPFLSLIEAQRSRVGLHDRYYEAIADSYRRRASLERAIGEPPASAHPSGARSAAE
jgi:outer membrane protein TolC